MSRPSPCVPDCAVESLFIDLPPSQSSPLVLPGSDPELYTPEELSLEDIKRYVQHYAQAAKNAIEAGFDGVEIRAPDLSVCLFLQLNEACRWGQWLPH